MVAIGNTYYGIRSGGTADVIGGATNDGHGQPVARRRTGQSGFRQPRRHCLVGASAVAAGNLVGLNATGTAPLDPGVGSGVTVAAAETALSAA